MCTGWSNLQGRKGLYTERRKLGALKMKFSDFGICLKVKT
jgi:hypothetical protein